MREAVVFRNDDPVGQLILTDEREYVFRYEANYFSNPEKPAISLTLPKKQLEYRSKFLFPFFFNMLAEGVNKRLQCRQLQIDERDYFSLLLATANDDTIGSVTLKPLTS